MLSFCTRLLLFPCATGSKTTPKIRYFKSLVASSPQDSKTKFKGRETQTGTQRNPNTNLFFMFFVFQQDNQPILPNHPPHRPHHCTIQSFQCFCVCSGDVLVGWWACVYSCLQLVTFLAFVSGFVVSLQPSWNTDTTFEDVCTNLVCSLCAMKVEVGMCVFATDRDLESSFRNIHQWVRLCLLACQCPRACVCVCSYEYGVCVSFFVFGLFVCLSVFVRVSMCVFAHVSVFSSCVHACLFCVRCTYFYSIFPCGNFVVYVGVRESLL